MSLRQVLYGGLCSKFETIASTLSKTRLRLSVFSMNGLRQPSSGAVGDSKITGSTSTARETRSGRSAASPPIAVAPAECPIVISIGGRSAVPVSALIVTVNVTDLAQSLCKRTVDTPEKSGRVQNHNRLALAAPVQGMQPDAVDVDETGLRSGKLFLFHL